jgi:hypothetical protein
MHRDIAHHSAELGQHRNLHLHRFEDHDRVAGDDRRTCLHDDCEDVADDFRDDRVGGHTRQARAGATAAGRIEVDNRQTSMLCMTCLMRV